MPADEMTSRAVTQVPRDKQKFRIWLEKNFRALYRDIKRIYNDEVLIGLRETHIDLISLTTEQSF